MPFSSDPFSAPFQPPVVLLGDFNNDQVVDVADYIAWRNGLDTIYSQDDYNVWRANFGATAQSAATAALPSSANLAVPEPGTLLMALIFAANLPTFWQKKHAAAQAESHLCAALRSLLRLGG